MKAARRSALAQADIDSALEYYTIEAAHAVDGFIDALEKATAHIERSPGTGSPRYAHELNIPRLLFWPFSHLARYPYALFYIEHKDHLDVIRVVHLLRDIPATLQPEE